jgi:hypothetical protein
MALHNLCIDYRKVNFKIQLQKTEKRGIKIKYTQEICLRYNGLKSAFSFSRETI